MYIVRMADLHFTWDPTKARANLAKHGISFQEAETAFSDDHALVMPDPEHSHEEDRFVLLGASTALRVVMVVHCEPDPDGAIRIISARRATRSERGQYAARWRG
jgi:uncharacterized DUF497 family protein